MTSRMTLFTMPNSRRQFNPSQPFGVVCHDAGGANQVVAMLDKFGWRPTWVVVDGPAALIWKQSFSDISPESDFFWLKLAHAVITGTGWASQLEYFARSEARQCGCHSIAVLDHWVNYRERFFRNDQEILPDEIWVVDSYAENMARENFPATPVILQPDCYAEREVAHVAPVTDGTPDVLLYLLEPIRSNWGKDELGEFQALRYFLERLPRLGLPNGTEIHLRLHPSEAPEKYDAFLNVNGDFPVRMALGSLAQGLSNCRWVAGCQTYALTLALRTGRVVFGSLPPQAPASLLPHQGIIHIRELIAS